MANCSGNESVSRGWAGPAVVAATAVTAENLCREARFTGFQRQGGFAEFTVADAHFCLPLPESYPDVHVAPLLCAGLIGYRCLRMAGEGETIGLYGFGAAAHIVIQVALAQGRRTFAFTRPGDEPAQMFARELGATWAGTSDKPPPEELDAAIIFAPAGELVPLALAAVRPGGVVVCGGIHMSDIPTFPYRLLWEERSVRSVANLTRKDGEDFLKLAPHVPGEDRSRNVSFGGGQHSSCPASGRGGAGRGRA